MSDPSPPGCSDCGQPSIGKFDLRERPKDYDRQLRSGALEDPTQFDRPLCASCKIARGV